jgi:hypothetical protein
MQTNLRTDDFCSYNQSAAPFYWVFEPYQYANTYVFGEVGINAAGGGPGSYVRPDIIDVDSFLSGRDDILSRCNPPVPGLDEVAQQPLIQQNSNNVNLLVAKDTREKKSAVDLSAVDFNRWVPNLPVDPQDIRFVIEAFSAQRGGLDTQNYTKSAWQPTVARGSAVNGPPGLCQTVLDPSRACGEYCNTVSGYSGWNGNVQAMMPGRPQNNYPFEGITSQQVKAVGATACAEQQFYGANYTNGSCGPQPPQRVLLDNNSNSNRMDRMMPFSPTSSASNAGSLNGY